VPTVSDQPDPAATTMLKVNARTVVAIGTAAFAVAFVVLLPFWNWLGEHGHRVWLWTALAGTVLGLIGFPLVRKHTREGRLG
jgi:Protein of unknown function (DUF2530)